MSEQPRPRFGDTIHGYELIRQIGQGVMGLVFVGSKRNEDWALKVFFHTEKLLRERFEREVEAMVVVGGLHKHLKDLGKK
jgi:hypothetical protein